MTPTQQVREMLAEGYDADTVVSVLLARSDDHDLRWMAEAWLRGAVDKEQRSQVRRAERVEFAAQRREQVERAIKQGRALAAIATRFTAEFRALPFSVDGRTVTWGSAQAADHAERESYLRRHADGVLETAARHREVLLILEETGAKCLDDLCLKAA